MQIQEVRLVRYKTLRKLKAQTETINVLTGRNNAGKSTFLSAFRLLDSAMNYARRRIPTVVKTLVGRRYGYIVPTENLPISLENIHTDLELVDTTVDFTFDNDAILTLYFPSDGGFIFFVQGVAAPKSPTAFKSTFPFQLIQVPVLGPLEDQEPLVQDATLKRGVGTPRASRHFRNYWHRNMDTFQDFANLISRTWEGMEIEPPNMRMTLKGAVLDMYCTEFRRYRELYWFGFGFQIWCQLLTHISRANLGDIIVVDEPETYLHPKVQKQLLGILRNTGAQVFMASHSATIIASANHGEVLGISRDNNREQRYKEMGVPLCKRLGLLP